MSTIVLTILREHGFNLLFVILGMSTPSPQIDCTRFDWGNGRNMIQVVHVTPDRVEKLILAADQMTCVDIAAEVDDE